MEDEIKGLESLQVWQRSLVFAVKICKEVIPLLPKDERWVMGLQLRRSAQSIPANIAEGYGRFHYQEGVRFCYIARGSLEETLSHLTLALELGYLQKEDYSVFADEIKELRRMLSGYIAYLKRTKRGENEPGSTHSVREDNFIYSPDLDTELPDTTDHISN